MAGTEQKQSTLSAQAVVIAVATLLGAGGGTVVFSPKGAQTDTGRLTGIESELSYVKRDLVEFQRPGERFTRRDGEAHARRIQALERRDQETRKRLDKMKEEGLEMLYQLRALEARMEALRK